MKVDENKEYEQYIDTASSGIFGSTQISIPLPFEPLKKTEIQKSKHPSNH